jgi:hypothetical protein
LVGILRSVKKNYTEAVAVGAWYSQLVRSKYTWALAAKKVDARVSEICSAGRK